MKIIFTVAGINFLLYLVPNSEIRRGFIVFFRDVKKRCSASLKRGIDKIKINKSLDTPREKSSPGSLDISGGNSSLKSHDMLGKNCSKNLVNTRKVTLVSTDSDIIYISTRL